MLKYFLIVALLLFSTQAFCQLADENKFCDKKWYCEMTKDADGTTHPAEKADENDYMYFLCDSTFTLSEKGIVLKGRWEYDTATMNITLVQDQINTMPERISFHIMEQDESHLVIIGQEGTVNEETAYLYTK